MTDPDDLIAGPAESEPLFRNAERHGGAHLPTKMEVRFDSVAAAAKALNAFSTISAGGLCVKTRHPHATGDRVELTLTVQTRVFEIKGVVSWVRHDVIGIRFDGVSVMDRARLQRMAKTAAPTQPFVPFDAAPTAPRAPNDRPTIKIHPPHDDAQE